MEYCQKCILPNTRPQLALDASRVCSACRESEKKACVDWRQREQGWRRIVGWAKSRKSRYDCVIPVSGGKDSTWQVVTCLEYGLRPLAITWKTPARTMIGQKNLDNLIGLGVDHIDWRISPKAESKFMLKAFEKVGSPAVPMHLALFAIPLTVAADFDIPLVVWGENSAVEYGGADGGLKGARLNSAWLKKYGVSGGTTAADWVSEEITISDLASYCAPTDKELADRGIRAVFLGYYFPWDPERSLAVAKAHGFRSRQQGPKVGYYNYADIDDDFISIHHYLKWYKFGFTRLFDNLSLEIRAGRMTRDEAIAVVRERGEVVPHEDIAKFCEFVGITKRDFWDRAERWRNLNIWERVSGRWEIRDFLIKDWDWHEVQREKTTAGV